MLCDDEAPRLGALFRLHVFIFYYSTSYAPAHVGFIFGSASIASSRTQKEEFILLSDAVVVDCDAQAKTIRERTFKAENKKVFRNGI
jgi:hypothetical protein